MSKTSIYWKLGGSRRKLIKEGIKEVKKLKQPKRTFAKIALGWGAYTYPSKKERLAMREILKKT